MTAPREELANLLRESRIRAGYRSHAAFAKKLHKSRPVISKAESPANPVPSDDVLAGWAEITGVPLDKLQELAQRIRLGPPAWFLPWEVIEARASVICWFAALLVPGLLQTEAYARAVLAWKPDSASAEANLKNRLARQAVLERVQLRVVILESVLYREVGDAATMVEQIEYLLELGARPNVTLQILPDTKAIAGALGCAFAIATEGSTDIAAYSDSHIRGTVHTDPDLISRAALQFDALRAEALPWTLTQEGLLKAVKHWTP
jgi:transcriptional regulator with XRE-family HTH domain